MQSLTRFQEDRLPLLQAHTFPKLKLLAEDGLVEWNAAGVKLTAQGRHFIRVACSAFDLYLQRGAGAENLCSARRFSVHLQWQRATVMHGTMPLFIAAVLVQ